MEKRSLKSHDVNIENLMLFHYREFYYVPNSTNIVQIIVQMFAISLQSTNISLSQ